MESERDRDYSIINHPAGKPTPLQEELEKRRKKK
jgi:hypothetical protein